MVVSRRAFRKCIIPLAAVAVLAGVIVLYGTANLIGASEPRERTLPAVQQPVQQSPQQPPVQTPAQQPAQAPAPQPAQPTIQQHSTGACSPNIGTIAGGQATFNCPAR